MKNFIVLINNLTWGKKMTHKLILVIDSKFAKIYEAKGLKLKNLISEYKADELGIGHKKQSLRTGFKKQASGPAHFLILIQKQKT